MNKARLIEEVAERTGLSRKMSEEFLTAFVDTVTETMAKGETVTIAGFGAFLPKFRSARMGVNPRKPDERIHIPAVTIPKFKAGANLKAALKGEKVEDSAENGTIY